MLAAVEAARLARGDPRNLATALLLAAAAADLAGDSARARQAISSILDLGDKLIPNTEWTWATVLRSLRRVSPTAFPAVIRVKRTFEAFESARTSPDSRPRMQAALRSWRAELDQP